METKLLKVLPFAAMVSMQFLDVGLTTIGKAALSEGMSQYVCIVYSNAIATLIIFPFSFFFNRKNLPPITFYFLCKLFLLTFLGVTVFQNCVVSGLSYSSPALVSAMSQLSPSFVFLIAVIFRMEKFDLKSSRSQIKVLGTLLSISGALIAIFYKGYPLLRAPKSNSADLAVNSWVIGGLILALAVVSYSIFITSQPALVKECTSESSVVSFYCLFGTIQTAIVALIAEKNNPKAWIIKPDIQIISVIYSAICGSLLTYATTVWCSYTKGPVFVAMFQPLGIPISTFSSVIFLGDTLYLGSIIGAIVIVTGFYGVIWAKSKEEVQVNSFPSSSSKYAPLLENHHDA